MNSERWSGATSLLACALALAGCASVSVYKVTADGKIDKDTPEGLRFYLPRPYVSVFEPFIISSTVYLARGEVSPDSNYILLTQVPTGLNALVNTDLSRGTQQTMGRMRIDATQVRVTERPLGGPQSAPAAGPAASAASAPAPAASAASAPEAKNAEIKGGVLNYKAINDNSAYAVTPQPRYFNILWLPDFDEQYVVTAKAGLGNAGVALAFGQGWSLQSLEATVDNSAIAKPLLDFYSGTLGALQKVATAKIEAPLAALTGKPQSVGAGASAPGTAATFEGGTPVTVKVTKVRVVAPGLYPVLKPKEVQAALSSSLADRILAPSQPFTNIAFNTYDVIVIEAARTTGDSALRIHQYVDSTLPGSTSGATDQGPADAPKPGVNVGPDLDKPLRDLRSELSKPENATTGKDYFVPKMTRDGSAIKVTLTKTAGGPAGTLATLPDDATIIDKVVKFLKASNVTVLPADVTVKR